MYMDITQQAGLRTGHQVALDNRLGRVLPDLDPLLNLLHDFLLTVPPFSARVIPFEFYSKGPEKFEGYHCVNLFVCVTTKRIILTWVLECETEEGL